MRIGATRGQQAVFSGGKRQESGNEIGQATAEKGAEIYLKIAHLPLGNTISDQTMHQLEARFGVKAREGYLR